MKVGGIIIFRVLTEVGQDKISRALDFYYTKQIFNLINNKELLPVILGQGTYPRDWCFVKVRNLHA